MQLRNVKLQGGRSTNFNLSQRAVSGMEDPPLLFRSALMLDADRLSVEKETRQNTGSNNNRLSVSI